MARLTVAHMLSNQACSWTTNWPPTDDGCATFMLAAGVPSGAIMEVLGHSGISVTMNTYAHVMPGLRQEAADAIDELFGA